jgi:AcrR family transcriptional regulator
MTDNIMKPWIDIGYEIFSKFGPTGLKVEGISKLAKKNKSSFYHHFADMEYFTQCLLTHHLQRTNPIVIRAEKCTCIVPDLLWLLIDIKQDLLFNRQLRINRHLPEFKNCFEKANKPVENAFIKIWSEALGLQEKEDLAKIVLNLAVENFYLQITEETLTYEWLLDYFNEIRKMVIGFKKIKNS